MCEGKAPRSLCLRESKTRFLIIPLNKVNSDVNVSCASHRRCWTVGPTRSCPETSASCLCPCPCVDGSGGGGGGGGPGPAPPRPEPGRAAPGRTPSARPRGRAAAPARTPSAGWD